MSALIVIAVLGVAMLLIGLHGDKRWLAPAGIAGLVAALLLALNDAGAAMPAFPHMVDFDRYARVFNAGAIGLTAMIFLFGADYYARETEHVAEQYALMLFSLCGVLVMTSYTSLIMLFLGIEIMSIPLYILAGGKKRSLRSNEASFKYFLLGSFASAFLLLGIALIYGATGSFQIPAMHADAQAGPIFLLGLFFLLVGLGFKVAAVPFHFWSPDVYEGAPTLVTAFMSTVVKMAAFAALFRLVGAGTARLEVLGDAFWWLTFLTLALGNLVALRQKNFKRLMAWSSIANSGFLLLLILSGHERGANALFYYLLTYSIATLGLFIIFILVKRAANGDERIPAFRGLWQNKPWLAMVTMVLMLSLAGIPPLAGFMAKYQVLWLAIDSGFLKTALFAVAMTLLGMVYYLAVMREAFAGGTANAVPVVSVGNALLIFACGLLTVLLGFMPVAPL